MKHQYPPSFAFNTKCKKTSGRIRFALETPLVTPNQQPLFVLIGFQLKNSEFGPNQIKTPLSASQFYYHYKLQADKENILLQKICDYREIKFVMVKSNM